MRGATEHKFYGEQILAEISAFCCNDGVSEGVGRAYVTDDGYVVGCRAKTEHQDVDIGSRHNRHLFLTRFCGMPPGSGIRRQRR